MPVSPSLASKGVMPILRNWWDTSVALVRVSSINRAFKVVSELGKGWERIAGRCMPAPGCIL